MIQVSLTQYEVQMAVQVGAERAVQSIFRNHQDRHGYPGNNPFEISIQGTAAEVAVAKVLGRYWSGHVNVFKAPDLAPNIQVRNRSLNGADLIVRNDDADDEIFVLTTGRIPNFRVVGWIKGGDAKNQQWYRSPIERPKAYFVPAAELRPIKELME